MVDLLFTIFKGAKLMGYDITIRDASISDVDFIIWIIETAGRSGGAVGFTDMLFPESKAKTYDFLYDLICSDIKSLFHFSNFKIAEINNQAVAGLSGYFTPEINSEDFRECLLAAQNKFKLSPQESEEMVNRIGVFVSCFPGLLDNAWVVEWVAVKPEYRKQGIINILLNNIISHGIVEKKCEVIQIAVAKGNTPAINAYKNIGFNLYDDKSSEEFESVFGYAGMDRLVIEKENFNRFTA